MKYEDGFCTKEQANKLRELGVVLDNISFGDVIVTDGLVRIYSAAELLELLPNTIEAPSWTHKNEKGEMVGRGDIKTVTLFIHKDAWEEDIEGWGVMYNHFLGRTELYSVAKEFRDSSLAQAVADMLIWVIENKYLTL